jgi:beta-phosphoglucomutase-like phosphatase (HAD superfamily)
LRVSAQPICVASSSTPRSLRQKLELCGLRERFGERIYSASQIANGKPAPDLFLFAATRMNVSPEHCAVIEDSPYGVQAGLTANVRVFAYARRDRRGTPAEAGGRHRLRRHASAPIAAHATEDTRIRWTALTNEARIVS